MRRARPLSSCALGLCLSLWAAGAMADPAVFVATWPSFRTTLPAGYTELPRPADASPAVLSTWQRTTPGGPVVMQFVRLDGALPQRPLRADEGDLLRGSDPFEFHDRAASRWALGFPVAGLAGTTSQGGRGLVRYAVALPTRGDALRVTVVAPAAQWRQASDDLDAVLRAATGPRSWRTRAERTAEWIRVLAGLPATGAMLGYAVLALGCVLRRRPVPQPWWAFAALAWLWAVCGMAFVLPTSLAQPTPALQAMGLAVVFGWRAWRRWGMSRGSQGGA